MYTGYSAAKCCVFVIFVMVKCEICKRRTDFLE
jgi:hypothetical protein